MPRPLVVGLHVLRDPPGDEREVHLGRGTQAVRRGRGTPVVVGITRRQINQPVDDIR
jgi:hypothetical protein